MLSYSQAQAILRAIPCEMAKEILPLGAAAGRVLAEALVTPFPSPSFTSSAMDGIALRVADADETLTWKVGETLFARVYGDGELPGPVPGVAVRIMTGAPVPPWADAVVPVEACRFSADTVSLSARPTPGAHLRRVGSDLAAGSLLFPAGTRLTPERLLVLASFGFARLPVLGLPEVALFSTGDELTALGQPLALGGVYDSSSQFLLASVRAEGPSPRAVRLADDPPAAACAVRAFLDANPGPKLLLTTGAVSAGEKDFIPQLARELGFDPLFHKVAIRPGKPVFVARAARSVWLGLPGNPISTLVGWHAFARPLLSAWAGIPRATPVAFPLAHRVEKPAGLTCFFRARTLDGNVFVDPRQGSASFAASCEANAIVELPPDGDVCEAGVSVPTWLL